MTDTHELHDGSLFKVKYDNASARYRGPYTECCVFCGRRPGLSELSPGTTMVFRNCVDRPDCDGHKKMQEGLRRFGVPMEPTVRVDMPLLRREDGTVYWRPPASPPGHGSPSWWGEPHLVHPISAVFDRIVGYRKDNEQTIRVPSGPWCAWCGWPIKWTPGPARDGNTYCEVCATSLTLYHDAYARFMRDFEAEVAQAKAPHRPMPARQRPFMLSGDLKEPRL